MNKLKLKKMEKILCRFSLLFLLFCSNLNMNAQNLDEIFSDAEKQTLVMLNEINKAETSIQKNNNDLLVSPRSLNPSGDLILKPSKDWTSGFFPGILWYLFELTGDKKWEEQARKFTLNIEDQKYNGITHDMGFKIYCSFGAGYRLTGDAMYKDVIIQGAKTLSKRFNARAGSIRSWDHSTDKWDFPVIIDNMMNLELLFEAARLTDDSSFYKIAVTHANTTIKNHFRPDYSSYHVIDYDTITGDVVKKNTHQGYSHESGWARGQAWALYGFTMCYRETSDPRYLFQAENIAGYILNNPALPEDLVPYWDFNVPSLRGEPRDASAAAIIASALYELGMYSKNGVDYFKKADLIMKSLTKNYRSAIGENKGFILLHSTGSKPAESEVDVPIIYADYYYLEALLRSAKLKK